MARQSISQSQAQFLNTGELDLMGGDENEYQVVTLDSLSNVLYGLAAEYLKRLEANLTKSGAHSSGALLESIVPTDVKVFGSVYTVEISAAKYAKFIDEGVDGWAKSRGSKYKFKTKGVDPNGEMVKSIKAWLLREGNVGRIKNRPTTQREATQMSITSATDRAAISAAYMIKRQGIKPTHFWRDATKEMRPIVERELAKALKVDIINSITV